MSESRRPTFDETVAAARKGSPWALGSLYRQFQPGLLRLVAVIAPHQAEDLASDVWLEVAAALPRFSGDERAFRSPDQADVVLMRVVEGLDVDEVARALGKPPGAVRTLQHRALRRLARQLDPEGPSGPLSGMEALPA